MCYKKGTSDPESGKLIRAVFDTLILIKLKENIEKTSHAGIRKALFSEETSSFLSQTKEYLEQSQYHNIEDTPYKSKFDDSTDEKAYRQWCVENCLFLNPLNDISKSMIVSQDIVQFPTYRSKSEKLWPSLPAEFSDIKRRYSYARFLLFEGLHKLNCPKYESNDLYLTDLSDGNYYDIATEKIKTAFGLIFSIFDKLSSILYNYFFQNKMSYDLKIAFNGRWLKEHFSDFENHFVKALYWIACDLTYFDPQGKAPTPNAKKLRKMRNCLEHGWLKISDQDSLFGNQSGLCHAYSITQKELIESTFMAFKLVRSSIMTATLAVSYHEKKSHIKEKNSKSSIDKEVPIWTD